MDDYQILKFASLFHDIGKFYQRADYFGKGSSAYDDKYKKLDKSDYGSSGAHAKWSADFTKEYFDVLVEELVLYHHNPKKSGYEKLCKMLQKADHHSSKERIRSVEEQEVLATPLTSIFSRISFNGENTEKSYVPLIELDFNKDLYPKKEKLANCWNLVEDYKRLWRKFVFEFKLLKTMDFETILELVKKYTSTIPSAIYKSESDISLYDHLKTTTAIGNCRYLYSKEKPLKLTDNQEEVYRIIKGDISGIQKFIYRVNSPDNAQRGMSKRLRGRSLYITLLCEAIANKIIHDLNLDSTNILFCGGGNFTIIAPNTRKTLDIIKRIDENVNSFFIKQFNAELYLSLVSISCDGDDLGNFGDILLNISNLLDGNKKHKFINHLDELFDVENEVNYHLCPVCGNKSLKNKFCKECNHHEKLGKNVANAEYMIKYVSDVELPNSDFFINFLNVGYIFRSKKGVINLVNNNLDVTFTIYKLNDTNFLDLIDDIFNDNTSFGFKVLGNNVPTIKEKPLHFNHLAQLSKGANKLGVLKMDVDNLSSIFAHGFNNLGDNGGSSISRISSLSFYLDLFFSGCINQIINKFKFYTQTYGHDELFDEIKLEFKEGIEKVYRPKKELPVEFQDLGNSTIYINYSGGDDLLVVGPYDDIIGFAEEFRNKFKKWTSCNDSINISGGIFISSPKFPIGKSAIIADRELKKSKDCGRDKLTVFNEVLKWKSDKDIIKGFDDLFKFGKYLEDLNESNKISNSFIYSLLHIWNSSSKFNTLTEFNEKNWEEYNKNKISSNRYIPLLMYKLRIIPKKDKVIREKLAKCGKNYMPWIKVPVSWASLRLR